MGPVSISVVDPSTLNLDPDPVFWPNLDLDRYQYCFNFLNFFFFKLTFRTKHFILTFGEFWHQNFSLVSGL